MLNVWKAEHEDEVATCRSMEFVTLDSEVSVSLLFSAKRKLWTDDDE